MIYSTHCVEELIRYFDVINRLEDLQYELFDSVISNLSLLERGRRMISLPSEERINEAMDAHFSGLALSSHGGLQKGAYSFEAFSSHGPSLLEGKTTMKNYPLRISRSFLLGNWLFCQETNITTGVRAIGAFFGDRHCTFQIVDEDEEDCLLEWLRGHFPLPATGQVVLSPHQHFTKG
jgi:hypothetical protein